MNIKWAIVLIVAVSSLSPHFAQDTLKSLSGFRDFKWGTSIKEVREREKAEYMQHFSGFGIEALSYKGEIADVAVRIDYTFKNGILVEGSYSITPVNYFVKDFGRFSEFVSQKHGRPKFRSGPNHTTDSIWVKENDYGLFKGPALYWVFVNGFIALYSQRFKDNATITILYTFEKIEDYSLKNQLQFEKFNVRIE